MSLRTFFATRRGGALGLTGTLLLAAVVAFWQLRATAEQWREQPAIQGSYIEGGEGLILAFHPAETKVSYHLPFGSVLFALHAEHAGPALRRFLNVACLPAMSLMLVALGVMIGSFVSGLLAAAAYMALEAGGLVLLPYGDYAFMVLVVGCVLVWRARAPSLGKTFLLAFSVGASLLFRSPLAFFPPALILYEMYFSREPRLRPYWIHGFVLAVVPYLFLIPWLWMNRVVNHQWILFEDGQADCNIITGALGIVSCVVGDWGALMPTPVDHSKPFAVLWWALAEIGHHPLRYAISYAARVAYVCSFHPWVCLLAVLALWLRRDRREMRSLAFLAAYFIGIHSFMSLKDDYMRPVWPLLVPIAATLWDRVVGSPTPRVEGARFRAAAAAVCVWVLLEAGFAGYVLFVTTRYGCLYLLRSPLSSAAMEAAFARQPEDPWLRRKRAELRLRSGDVSGALMDYSHALAVQPNEPELRLDMAWALYLRGSPRYLLERCPYPYPIVGDELRPMQTPVPPYIKPYLYKALAWHSLGRESEAGEQLRAAWAAVDGYQTMHRIATDKERSDIEVMRSNDGFIVLNVFDRQFDARPASERAYLLREFLRMSPRDAGLWVGQGEAALELGDKELARSSYRRARSLPLDEQGAQRAAALGARLGGSS